MPGMKRLSGALMVRMTPVMVAAIEAGRNPGRITGFGSGAPMYRARATGIASKLAPVAAIKAARQAVGGCEVMTLSAYGRLGREPKPITTKTGKAMTVAEPCRHGAKPRGRRNGGRDPMVERNRLRGGSPTTWRSSVRATW